MEFDLAHIVITSATSGTASMRRIMEIVAGERMKMHSVARPALTAKPDDPTTGTYIDPKANRFYWFQGPRFWNPALDFSQFKTIVHFRDPRDLACNQYWWALQHPNTHDTPEVAEEKRRKVEAGGIDKYALGRNNREIFDIFRSISDGAMGNYATYTSYTQLCVAFDELMDRLCRVFDRRQSEVAHALFNERPERLSENPEWVKVGGTWKGADVFPGRFRRDLKPETIGAITEKWKTELQFCQRRDAAVLSHHYD
jgi:hypothetical protein